MFKNRSILLLLLAVVPLLITAQIDNKKLGFSIFYAEYGVVFPGGALADQFGISNTVGGGYLYKTEQNWLFGVEAHYLFSQNIKDEADIFSLIESDHGDVLDDNGYNSEVRTHLRGFNAFARFGKLFPVLGPNKNSGIVVIGGVGYSDHLIFIDVMDNLATSLSGDYRNGYDQYAGGFALTQFVGYMYFSNSKLANFFAGIEVIEGFSSYYREWDFNTIQPYPDYDGIDMMVNIKIGWMFPVYRRTPKEYYFD